MGMLSLLELTNTLISANPTAGHNCTYLQQWRDMYLIRLSHTSSGLLHIRHFRSIFLHRQTTVGFDRDIRRSSIFCNCWLLSWSAQVFLGHGQIKPDKTPWHVTFNNVCASRGKNSSGINPHSWMANSSKDHQERIWDSVVYIFTQEP